MKLMKGSDETRLDINDAKQRDTLFQLNRDLKVVTARIMKTLTAFHCDYKQFKGRFVLFDKVRWSRAQDYVKVMRDDIKEVQSTLRGLDFLISEEE